MVVMCWKLYGKLFWSQCKKVEERKDKVESDCHTSL